MDIVEFLSKQPANDVNKFPIDGDDYVLLIHFLMQIIHDVEMVLQQSK